MHATGSLPPTVVNQVMLKNFIMNNPRMKDFTGEPEVCTDVTGRLYDGRLRGVLETLVGPESARRLETFAAIRWLASSTHRFMERWVDKHGLSEGRMQVLMRLRHQGDQPLGVLAEAMHVSPRNITGLVDHLERSGLVTRVPDPEDRRSVRAHLTGQGHALVDRIWREFMQRSLVLVEDLPQEDLEVVRDTCLRLIKRIESRLNQEAAATPSQRSKT